MSSRVLVAKPTQTGKTNEAVVPALTFSDRTAQQLPVQQTPPVSPATFAGNFAGIPVAASPDQRGGYPPLPPAIRPPWPIQAKLEVGAVDDPLEREADRVAEQVMGMPEPAATAKAAGPAFAFQSGSLTASRNDNKVADNPTMSGYTSKVQRECACGGSCEKCKANEPEEEQGQLRRKTAYPQISAANSSPSSTGMEAPPIVHEVLRSPGQPLDAATRAFFEPRFGRDLSGVRVHKDHVATQSARAINALAYAADHRIVLADQDYASGTIEGTKLLAHELVHVVQQTAGLTFGQQRKPRPVQRTPAAAKETQPRSENNPQLLSFISIEGLGQLYATSDAKVALNDPSPLIAPFHKSLTASWVQGAGRKLIQSEIARRVTTASEQELIKFLNFIDAMHEGEYDTSRKNWLGAQVGARLPLTPPQRAELRRQTGNRIDKAFTQFTQATKAVGSAIKASVASHAAMVSLIFDVFMGLSTPGLSKGIAALADGLPIDAGNLSYRAALKALDASRTAQIFAAATKVGKETIKSQGDFLFGDTATDVFIRQLNGRYQIASQALDADLVNRTDQELGIVAATYDASVADEPHFIPIVKELVSRFQSQVEPIGQKKSVSQTDPFDRTLTSQTGLVWAQVDFANHAEYLVQIELTNETSSPGTRPSILAFKTFVDSDFKDMAIGKADSTQPRGIQTIPSSMITGFPNAIPANAVRK